VKRSGDERRVAERVVLGKPAGKGPVGIMG
jgi:hypothetical protein